MKRMKKLVSILLVAVMMLAMATTVFASESETTATVTVVDNLSDHTFAAYQIFKGDYSYDEDTKTETFSNVEWGDGVTSSTLLSKLKSDSTVVVKASDNTSEVTVAGAFNSATTAADVAQVLSEYSTYKTLVEAFVEAAYASITTTSTKIGDKRSVDLTTGYYLIVDTTEDVGDSTYVKAYNNALLQVVGSSIEIAKKTDAPTVEKKVYEEDYTESSTGYVTGYNNVADYDIGDAVPYELIGTIPDTSEYSYYRYVFTDTLSKGLTIDTSSITVYLAADKSSKDDNWKEVSNIVTVSEDKVTNWTCATASTTNATYSGGTKLTISFDNILTLVDDEGNVISLEGYKYIIVEYTATLNDDAVVGLDGNPNEVYLTYSSNPNSTGVGDSDDKTEDTPEDKVIVFTYELDVTKVDSTNSEKVLKNAEFVLYKEVSETKYYWTGSTTSEPWSTSENNAKPLESDEYGKFSVVGLDDGTYYLKETKAPTGYNLLSNPISLVITATTVNGQTWAGTARDALTAITISVDGGTAASGDVNEGTVSATVENTPGSGLPTTGGMGTTILYIIGAILVIGAGVLLVTRRRVSR